MIALGAIAMWAAALGYVLWPLFRRRSGSTLRFQDVEPPARQ